MATFWLATFELSQPSSLAGSDGEPMVGSDDTRVAIEVIKEDDSFGVLLSSIDHLEDPKSLSCHIGFANVASACSVWRDRGFPLVDSTIDFDAHTGVLQVFTPYFSDGEAMEYGERLLRISGIRFVESTNSASTLTTIYEQFQEGPDAARPATNIRRKALKWNTQRRNVEKLSTDGLTIDPEPTRYPSLQALKDSSLRVAKVWSGLFELDSKPILSKEPPLLVGRVDTFGVPAFRFEDVEVLGFRIDLGSGRDIDERLAELIKPLNFHVHSTDPAGSIPDFRYRPATRTVLVELLRYGRMKLQTRKPPLTLRDYQSQHELVVRILVGRVDDDTGQAHSPAVYVPAIFVDNPWSKIVGRDLQGFPKCMADFCVINQEDDLLRLRPDGRLRREEEPRQLADISEIKLVDRALKGEKSNGKVILTLDCPSDRYANWNDFQDVDLGLALGRFSLADTRWRQSDFDQGEFRRSFARAAITENLKGFHSIQVSPVGQRDLEKAWITGTFTIDNNVRFVNPAGGARLTFHTTPMAPPGWKAFCELLGIKDPEEPGLRSFQTGNWYRLKFAMNMTIDDGLEWTDQTP